MTTTRVAGSSLTALRVTPRGAWRDRLHPDAATAERGPDAPDVVLVLYERRTTHTELRPDPAREHRLLSEHRPSGQLAARRLIAERHGASATEWRLAAPTNAARNYYDDGRDLAAEYTLELKFFASVHAAIRLLTAAAPALIAWLARRAPPTATLSLDATETFSAARTTSSARARCWWASPMPARAARGAIRAHNHVPARRGHA